MVYWTPMSSSRSGTASPVVPYPGYDRGGDYVDPTPAARLKFEGFDFAEKHKGTIGNWVFKRDGGVYESPRPVPRCPTSQSVENYNRDKYPAIKSLMNGTATPRQETVRVRNNYEGVQIAEKGREDHMTHIINQSKDPGQTFLARRTTFEGVEFASRGREDHIKTIFDEAGKCKRVYTDKQTNPFHKSISNCSHMHVPRCPTSESVDNLKRDRQSPNKSVINGQATPRSYTAPCRVAHDGVYIAEKHKRDHMTKIFNENDKPKRHGSSHVFTGKRTQQMTDSGMNSIIPNPAVPRIQNEPRGPGYAVQSLMHTGGVILDPKPSPRVTTIDAARNYNKDKVGKVNRILKETGRKMCVPIPGLQAKSLYYQPKVV